MIHGSSKESSTSLHVINLVVQRNQATLWKSRQWSRHRQPKVWRWEAEVLLLISDFLIQTFHFWHPSWVPFFCRWFFYYYLFSNEYLSSHHKIICLFIVSSVFFRPVPSKLLKNEKFLKAGRRDLTVGGRKSVVPPQVVVLLIPFQNFKVV